jgi:hypothetical protein
MCENVEKIVDFLDGHVNLENGTDCMKGPHFICKDESSAWGQIGGGG